LRAFGPYDAPLLGGVTRLFVDSLLGRYQRRLRTSTPELAHSGAVLAAQRASSDLKLNPHLRAETGVAGGRERAGSARMLTLPPGASVMVAMGVRGSMHGRQHGDGLRLR
jgi:hypothetical protein